MWLNSTTNEEPYPGLDILVKPYGNIGPPQGTSTGAAWLSSVRVLRRTVYSGNERNPCPVFYMSQGTARDNWEEGEDDAKSAWPLRPGPHTWYNGRYNGSKPKGGG